MTVTGRLRGRGLDMVICGDVSIHSAEIEQVLLEHDAEAAEVDSPSPDLGEELEAVIVARQSVADTVPRAACAGRTARSKIPRSFFVADALPKNSAGKIVKAELSQQLATERQVEP